MLSWLAVETATGVGTAGVGGGMGLGLEGTAGGTGAGALVADVEDFVPEDALGVLEVVVPPLLLDEDEPFGEFDLFVLEVLPLDLLEADAWAESLRAVIDFSTWLATGSD